MSIWVDKKASVTGPGLHALVLGVSDYQWLPAEGKFPPKDRVTLGLHKVKTPATGAFRFARWLRHEFWHPDVQVKTIRLLLSPSPEECVGTTVGLTADESALRTDLAAAAATQPRAATAHVWQAMQDWKKDCKGDPDGIAVLYAAGHGIQWGHRDDALVLLEDFSNDELFLNQTIDVGKTLTGMKGNDMPQTQFYFVDACRVQPDEFSKYSNVGSGLSLRGEHAGEDRRCAPMYFAACPGTTAAGLRGSGTYLAEGLIDCLRGGAAMGPDNTSLLPVQQSHWHVSVAGLQPKLEDRVSVIAARDFERQDVVVGGLVRSGTVCAYPAPPKVTVVIDVDPDDAARRAQAELWSWNSATLVKERAPCWERPLHLNDVPAGLYILKLLAKPPFKVNEYAVNVKPPEWKERITLS